MGRPKADRARRVRNCQRESLGLFNTYFNTARWHGIRGSPAARAALQRFVAPTGTLLGFRASSERRAPQPEHLPEAPVQLFPIVFEQPIPFGIATLLAGGMVFLIARAALSSEDR